MKSKLKLIATVVSLIAFIIMASCGGGTTGTACEPDLAGIVESLGASYWRCSQRLGASEEYELMPSSDGYGFMRLVTSGEDVPIDIFFEYDQEECGQVAIDALNFGTATLSNISVNEEYREVTFHQSSSFIGDGEADVRCVIYYYE